MKLSIIIPHYNSPQSLEKLLNSIPVKDEIEVIVIDDKSNKYVEIYKELYLKYSYIKFLENNTQYKGAGVCRNIGIKNSIGKYILFADADDFFVDNFYDYVEKYFESDNDIVYFIPCSVELDTKKESDRHIGYKDIVLDYIENNNLEQELNLKYGFISPWSKLIKREFIVSNNIEFDKTLVSNDVMFSAKTGYLCTKFDVSEEIIYCITKNSGSLTKTFSEEIFDERFTVFINFYKYLKLNLTKEEFDLVHDLDGVKQIIRVFRYKLGLSKAIKVFKCLKDNEIKLISDNSFKNIDLFIKRANKYIKRQKNDNRYIIRK